MVVTSPNSSSSSNQPVPSSANKLLNAASYHGKWIGALRAFGMFIVTIIVFFIGVSYYRMVEVRTKVIAAKLTTVAPYNGSDTSRAVTYEFIVDDETITGTGTAALTATVGDIINVEYNPQNPKDNAIDIQPAAIGIGLIIVSALMLLGTIAFYLFSQTLLGSTLVTANTFASVMGHRGRLIV